MTGYEDKMFFEGHDIIRERHRHEQKISAWPSPDQLGRLTVLYQFFDISSWTIRKIIKVSLRNNLHRLFDHGMPEVSAYIS